MVGGVDVDVMWLWLVTMLRVAVAMCDADGVVDDHVVVDGVGTTVVDCGCAVVVLVKWLLMTWCVVIYDVWCC